MAPEQAAGQGTDTRADVWSFGVVLWEMLTGSKLFDGETVSHVLAAVLTAEPDLGDLPEDTPPRIADLIGRCLRKKPKMRVQAIGDVRIALEEYLADPESATDVAGGMRATRRSEPIPCGRRALPWAAAAALGLALIAAVFVAPLGAEKGDQGDDPAAGRHGLRSERRCSGADGRCHRMGNDRLHRRR